ncbi:MAG: alkyl sulfatase dimerization domain-containing protein [Myxococcota bacterium]
MVWLWTWLACNSPAPDPAPAPTAEASLTLREGLFRREVIEVVDGVHVAIGFGLANSILLEGDDGVVIVDTMESGTAAREVLTEFRKITDKPLAAIIFTHNHADHVFGSGVMSEGKDVPIWAHATTESHIDRVVNVIRDTLQVRSLTMFGTAIPESRRIEAGIGPRLRFDPAKIALARPTHTFEGRIEIEVAGLQLELVHAPGETDDQIFVFLPDRRILLPGDNIYQAYPNLYTLRGTRPRDTSDWVRSLDAMRDRNPEVLVPSHTRPVVGAAEVESVLRAYRDGIQYVHDQTVRGMNQGQSRDELAATIRLPPHLASHPWLQEHYGMVPHAVRAIVDGYLGWFDGDASDLEPVPPAERARRYAEAFGAGVPLSEATALALADGDLAWAAEIGRLWVESAPQDAQARATLASIYDARAEGHRNMNVRHWYLTQAGQLRGEIEVKPFDSAKSPPELVTSIPIDAFLSAMPSRLRAEDVLDVDEQVALEFSDLKRTFVLHVRHGVAELRERPATGVDRKLVTDSATFKRMSAKQISPALAVADGRIRIEGGTFAVARILGWFGP